MEVAPTPTDEEAAAIAVALEVVLRRRAAPALSTPETTRWRFAGRWWSKPVPVRRDRPW